MFIYSDLLKFSKLKLNHCYTFILNIDIKHEAYKSYKLSKLKTTIKLQRTTGYFLLGTMIILFSWVSKYYLKF